MRNRTWMAVVSGLALTIVAVQIHLAQSQERRSRRTERSSEMSASKVTYAVAMVHGLGDHKVNGKVTFTQTEDGIEIVAELTGLQPGEHGFHVHEFGDCSMADGKCAGAHFNPDKKDHGSPDSADRHVGDLGNIKASSTGEATYKRTDTVISLNGPHSIIGRSVIVHAKAYDFK